MTSCDGFEKQKIASSFTSEQLLRRVWNSNIQWIMK